MLLLMAVLIQNQTETENRRGARQGRAGDGKLSVEMLNYKGHFMVTTSYSEGIK